MTETDLHRRNVLPALARHLKVKTYLEIGVKGGKTFLPIPARNKYGVDPRFRITRGRRLKSLFHHPGNWFCQLFEMTSDRFFEEVAPTLLAKRRLDLVFVDGLHTHEQSWRDIVNALGYLNPQGVMVIHDTSPPHAAAAYPAGSIVEARRAKPEGWDGHWCGDVWKSVVRLRMERPELAVTTIDADSGMTIVHQGSDGSAFTEVKASDIADLDYSDMKPNRANWLNITPFSDVDAVISAVASNVNAVPSTQ